MGLLHLLMFASLLSGTQCYRIVCVYTNWSQYRPDGGKFLPEDVDPTLCTHLIYVYAKIKGNKLMAVEWNDEGTRWSDGMYDRVNNLKQINPELKTLLGVGGWMMGSKDFSRMSAGRNSRRIFAQSTVKFLRKRGFDGLTIDWQYPTMRGGRPRDRVNFSLLLKELRTAFDDESKRSGTSTLLLTAGVSASKNIIDKAYEIDNITRYTDFVNVMAYDLHGPWENFTGHPSPLYPRQEELGPIADINVDTAMKYWIDNVADRSKLVLGIAAYGRTFTLKDPKYTGFMVPTLEPGTAGEFTREPGMLAYYERCNEYFDATHVWDKNSKVSYWYRGDQWVATEDIESVKAKVTWVRCNFVGGVMLSSLDMDDYAGTYCSGETFPLLNSININLVTQITPQQCVRQIDNTLGQPPIIPHETTTFDLSLYPFLEPDLTTAVSTEANTPLQKSQNLTENAAMDLMVINTGRGDSATTAFIHKSITGSIGVEKMSPESINPIKIANQGTGIKHENIGIITGELSSAQNNKMNVILKDRPKEADKAHTNTPSQTQLNKNKSSVPTHNLLNAILAMLVENKEKKGDVLGSFSNGIKNDRAVLFKTTGLTDKGIDFGKKAIGVSHSVQVMPSKNEPDWNSLLFSKETRDTTVKGRT